MAALLIKVGALMMKTLAKPLAVRFEGWVMGHPVARQHVIKAAQIMHRWEVYISRGAEGKTGRAFIPDMTDDKSLEMASKLASETFIFTVGVSAILFEYSRSQRKEAAKKRQEAAERRAILEAAREERRKLADENREQFELIQHLVSRVDALEEALKAQREREAAAASKSLFGGFFGTRAL